MNIRHTKESLEEVVKKSSTVAEVIRNLGLGPTGGNHRHIRKQIKKFGIDTSHFLGQAWSRGMPSSKKKSAKDILVHTSNRPKGNQLTRAMLELGVSHICSECNNDNTYNGKPLTLQVDHID